MLWALLCQSVCTDGDYFGSLLFWCGALDRQADRVCWLLLVHTQSAVWKHPKTTTATVGCSPSESFQKPYTGR